MKIIENLGRALGLDLGSIFRGFWVDFGSSWAPKSEKRRSINSNEKSLKKSHAGNYEPGGGAFKQSSFHPGTS